MYQKQKFGKIKFFAKKIIKFFSNFNPRYQLSLDCDYFDVNYKNRKYKFKSFGDHSFPEFTFSQIINSESILFNIHPNDLIIISEKNYIQEKLKYQLRIEEFLRNNKYKMYNSYGSNIISGDEICDNPTLLEQIEKIDLFKIAYNTGFERGRKLSKLFTNEIQNEKPKENPKDNVVNLTLV